MVREAAEFNKSINSNENHLKVVFTPFHMEMMYHFDHLGRSETCKALEFWRDPNYNKLMVSSVLINLVDRFTPSDHASFNPAERVFSDL